MSTESTAGPIDPGPLAEVAGRPEGGRWILVLVRDLRHPPAAVWAALTDPAQVSRWAPYTADRNLDAVGEATLTMLDGGSPVELPSSVRRAEAPRLLEYTWGTDLLRWELTPTDEGTRLTLSQTVEGRDWMSKVAAGWHLCLLVAERLLDGRPIAPIIGEDAMNYGWGALNEAYAEKLGVGLRAGEDR
ncbi:SRPBCC family protein [Georgenia sp. SYP-B2076]|uniref:SRPBCC family protein n=1 Tax=Georgenia sp. SYP-B2076 TaxID=2495881 RepID=UPI000F8D8875|nr:SRPBCC family protein [Georgenia sp. SYP-B2076]